ncbi:proline utilization trans-activator [Fusarium albosuccineum]|uniref:Proline utilization trans-activator n=1 Tax=Fusarium albosuccineum TaxID=1237068 RepID=A0A8H4KRC9_9HYPO|nr:proline utilization trans-activator [Fusarium albosuccineum]
MGKQNRVRKRAPKAYLNELETRAASSDRPSSGAGVTLPSDRRLPESLNSQTKPDNNNTLLEADDEHGSSRSQLGEHGHTQSPSIVRSGLTTRRESPDAPLMNPFAVDRSSYFRDTNGRPVHLGTSSNWSFGTRVLATVYENVMHAPLPPDNLLFDAQSYDLGWDGKQHGPPEADTRHMVLPSADYALFLINSFKFHCGNLFHLYEEERFMEKFSLYHENAADQSSLWFVHYLLILAFGKAFVVHSSKATKPPGAEWFVQAMKLLPSFILYGGDHIELVQVLCCAALYLHCLDFRAAAYRMIGQALRVALEDGMHTEMCSQNVDDPRAQRCRRAWWTVYMLDRQMSSLMGVPMGISDDAISAALPVFLEHPQKAMAVDIQIRLSRALAQILDSGLITSSALMALFLQSKMGHSNPDLIQSVRSGNIRALLLICIESAQQMLVVLATLQGQSLLDSFLRFDLDAIFTSTIAILIAAAIDPSLVRGHTLWSQHSHSMLNEMTSRGNRVAFRVQSELKLLEDLLDRLPGSPPQDDDNSHLSSTRTPTFISMAQTHDSLSPGDLYIDEFNLQDGYTTEQLISLANSIDIDSLDWL